MPLRCSTGCGVTGGAAASVTTGHARNERDDHDSTIGSTIAAATTDRIKTEITTISAQPGAAKIALNSIPASSEEKN